MALSIAVKWWTSKEALDLTVKPDHYIWECFFFLLLNTTVIVLAMSHMNKENTVPTNSLAAISLGTSQIFLNKWLKSIFQNIFNVFQNNRGDAVWGFVCWSLITIHITKSRPQSKYMSYWTVYGQNTSKHSSKEKRMVIHNKDNTKPHRKWPRSACEL